MEKSTWVDQGISVGYPLVTTVLVCEPTKIAHWAPWFTELKDGDVP